MLQHEPQELKNICGEGNPQDLEVRTLTMNRSISGSNPAEDLCLPLPSFLSSVFDYYHTVIN